MTLTQKQAEYRSSIIQQQSLTYYFHLILYPTYYIGFSQCQFTLLKECGQLFIDCTTKKIKKLIINQHVIQNYRHQSSHLYLNNKKLNVGINRVLVVHENIYDTDQRGMMSFVDVDSKQYLYTTIQAYFAHRVFAVFDQPDLKSAMSLSVVCPISWTKVLSNEHPTFNQQYKIEKYLSEVPTFHKQSFAEYLKQNIQQNQHKNFRMALFPPTKSMSTYLYCVLAGPFEQIQLKETYNNIPMSLYCSTSYLPYVQKMAPYLFETTVECMRFFQKFFGVPYSFSKYDQAFVHEMQSCAMQNTGMVTYHDAQYIWRDQVTLQKALDLADTMAHQLAHHWFGNLTTMKWWDDLWLNQSFAEFIGYYVLQKIQNQLKIVKFQSSMAQFLIKKSQSGYADDKAISTHPIRGIVQNTAVAEAIFDGITYAKGAAVLKQLVLLMGDDKFSAALRNYFTKYAYKNTTLNDFIDCLQQQFQNSQNITLHEWKNLWIEIPSLNELEPIWYKSQHLQQIQENFLTIIQRPYTEKYPTLRPHKIKIALFKQNCSYDVIQVFIPAQKQTKVNLNPQQVKKYQAVLLNYEDHTFAKIIFDNKSQQFFTKNLLKINDTLTRTYIWRNFYDMVVDGVIPSLKYIDLFVTNIGQELSDTIVQRNYESVIQCIQLYTPQKYRQQLYTRLFYFTLSILQKTSLDKKNRLVTLKDNLCKLAKCDISIRLLYKWYLNNYPSLNQYKLSNSDKWQIITKLFTLKDIQNQQKLKILQKHMESDQSQTSNLQKMKCLAIICSDQQFQQYYLSLQNPTNQLTINTKKYIIEGLTNNYNKQKMLKYKNRYFTDIQKCCNKLTMQHLRNFIINFQPIDDNLQETIKEFKNIQINDQKLEKVKYNMIKLIDSLQKRLNTYKKFMSCL